MKIFEAFILDNELTLLEHKLRELYDYVDVFVLLEAAETFQGRPKPLNFQSHQKQFAWAKPKLRPISLPRLPGKTTWEREAFQRNAIQLGLYDAQPDDIVLIMDADEIPSRSVLKLLREEGLERPHRLMMTRHYGRFDTLAPRSACCVSPNDPFPYAVPDLKPGTWDNLDPTWWCMPGVAVRFKDIAGDVAAALPSRTPNDLRRSNQSAPRLKDAGRHLSSIASAEELQMKLSHFSHAEHADQRSLDLQHLARTRRYGVHARGWWYAEPPVGALPEDLGRLQKHLAVEATRSTNGAVTRCLLRTWAWIRTLPGTPPRVIAIVDGYFERLKPLLILLLLVDLGRSLAARWKTRNNTSKPTAH